MKKIKNINQLVRDLKNGSEEAFDVIYDIYKDLVFFVIISILKDWHLSEEVMQDTFLRMYNNIEKYQEKNFKAWLLKIARNLAINEYNKRQPHIEYNDDIVNETYVNDQETSELINELKQYLSNDEFEVIVLYIVYNLKHKDIAKTLDKPLGTILWIYRKAIQKLKNNYFKGGTR